MTNAPERRNAPWVVWGQSAEGQAALEVAIESRKTNWDVKAEGGTWRDLHLKVIREIQKEAWAGVDPKVQEKFKNLAKLKVAKQ